MAGAHRKEPVSELLDMFQALPRSTETDKNASENGKLFLVEQQRTRFGG